MRDLGAMLSPRDLTDGGSLHSTHRAVRRDRPTRAVPGCGESGKPFEAGVQRNYPIREALRSGCSAKLSALSFRRQRTDALCPTVFRASGISV